MPLFYNMKDLSILIGTSKSLSKNWVNQQSNLDEKKQLKEILTNDYPALKDKISGLSSKLTDEKEKEQIATVLAEFDKIQANEQKVTTILAVDSSFSNDVLVTEAIDLYDGSIEKQSKAVLEKLNSYITEKRKSVDGMVQQSQIDKEKSNEMLITFIIGSVVLVVVVSIASAIISIRNIVTPLNKSKEIIEHLGEGRIVKMDDVKDTEDEIGNIITALRKLLVGLNTKVTFATEIGKGNYAEDFQLLSNDDKLGVSLIEMRDNLVKNAKEEDKRAWANGGMANFSDILRSNSESIETLATSIISNLVKYVGANQGGLFVVNDTNPNDKYLDLVACYAWDKTKHVSKRINEGEGLVGQAWQEGDIIYITEVPQNFVKITSGLGLATPNSIIIVPLTVNDETYGVIELASFNLFEEYQIEFLKKLAESIASTISSSKVNERTKILLEQSQMQAEQMRAQEEEMRQNMEEMQATSEEAERKALNYESAIQRLNDEINELSTELKNSKG